MRQSLFGNVNFQYILWQRVHIRLNIKNLHWLSKGATDKKDNTSKSILYWCRRHQGFPFFTSAAPSRKSQPRSPATHGFGQGGNPARPSVSLFYPTATLAIDACISCNKR